MEFAVGSCLHECRTFSKRGQLLVSQSHIDTCCVHARTHIYKHTPQPLLPGREKRLSVFTRLFLSSKKKEQYSYNVSSLADWYLSFPRAPPPGSECTTSSYLCPWVKVLRQLVSLSLSALCLDLSLSFMSHINDTLLMQISYLRDANNAHVIMWNSNSSSRLRDYTLWFWIAHDKFLI